MHMSNCSCVLTKKTAGSDDAPKFPSPHNLLFLLRYYNRTKEKNAWTMVEKTLRAMRLGGIFDQIGFGFHRYSTDAQWLVPHFEKMLYDQALLALAYVEAYQASGACKIQVNCQRNFRLCFKRFSLCRRRLLLGGRRRQ